MSRAARLVAAALFLGAALLLAGGASYAARDISATLAPSRA
jgi:hypothetical protein